MVGPVSVYFDVIEIEKKSDLQLLSQRGST